MPAPARIAHPLAPRHALTGALTASLLLASAASTAAPPSAERMWEVIQAQQREIERLKAQLERAEQQAERTEEKVEATAQVIEQRAEEPAYPSAARWAERTQIGAYGEVHYNNLANDSTGDELDQVDIHRFVLAAGHQFNDWLRFFGEIEFEHAFLEASELEVEDANGDGVVQPGEIGLERKSGEFEVEQLWVEADVHPRHRLRAGVDLIPVGILNPTHEPPTFFGVERNPVETNIIPTTWWEAGIGGLGEIAPGWSYHLALHSGLDTPTSGGSAFNIRSGRSKISKADASNGAVTGQIRYTGFPGLEVGVTGQYQGDVTQGTQDIDATLVAGHVNLRKGPFGFRAVAARWDLDDGAAGAGPASGPSPGRDVQYGWYVEPAYFVDAPGPTPGELGFFARYNEWDNNAGDDGTDTGNEQIDVGFNYWPHPDVVFKFDYQEQMDAADFDGFNLGVGFQF